MAAFTGSVTGDWSAQATWGGSGPPGTGDTITINDGITVTVSDTRVIGSTAALGNAISLSESGTLVVANGGTLTCQGSVTKSGTGAGTAVLQINGGGTFQFDTSGIVGTPIPAINPGANKFKLYLNGSSTSSVATIKSATGAPRWKITSSARDFCIVSDYADIKNADDGSNLGLEYIGSTLNTSINHTIFTDCSQLRLTGGAAVDFVITNTTWTSSVGNFNLVPRMTAATTGLRTFTNLVLDKRILADGSIEKFNFTGSLFQDRVTLGGTTTAGTATAFSGNLATNGDTKVMLVEGSHTITDNYIYATVATNPHGIEINTAQSGTQAVTLNGNVFEHSGSDGTGNCFVPTCASFSAAAAYTVKNNIALPNAASKGFGDIATLYLDQTNVTWTIDHNTVCVAGSGADTMCIAQINEQAGAGALMKPGNITSFKNNIAWSGSAGQGYKTKAQGTRGRTYNGTASAGGASTLTDSSATVWTANRWQGFLVKIITGTGANQVRSIASNTTTVLTVSVAWGTPPDATSTYEIYPLDVLTPSNSDYNAGYQLATATLYDETATAVTYSGSGYHQQYMTSGQLPGVHDVDNVNPGFVASTRNLAAWDTALGGAGTAANAIAEIAKMNNRSGYNTAYTPAALVTWVKAGFQPTATQYHAASDNVSPSNGWIGAVAGPSNTVRRGIAATMASRRRKMRNK